jgi:hypothetical protein
MIEWSCGAIASSYELRRVCYANTVAFLHVLTNEEACTWDCPTTFEPTSMQMTLSKEKEGIEPLSRLIKIP